MWLRTSCEMCFEIDIPTPFILMLRPRSGAHQWVSAEEYRLYPSVPAFEFTDDYGNLCQRLVAQPGDFRISTCATVRTADCIDVEPGAPFTDVQNLPDGVLKYLLPSRYCESESFYEMAFDITANQRLGYDQVAAIEEWIRTHIKFEPGSSDVPVSAAMVNQRGYGVCRDLSHMGVAMCRALTIPARVVVGYLHGLQPMEMHAWFEAFVNGRWYTFDGTQHRKSVGYVAIGYGRDAADVAIYNQFGPPVIATYQSVSVDIIDD